MRESGNLLNEHAHNTQARSRIRNQVNHLMAYGFGYIGILEYRLIKLEAIYFEHIQAQGRLKIAGLY